MDDASFNVERLKFLTNFQHQKQKQKSVNEQLDHNKQLDLNEQLDLSDKVSRDETLLVLTMMQKTLDCKTRCSDSWKIYGSMDCLQLLVS